MNVQSRRGKTLLSGHVICSKAKGVRKHLIADAGEVGAENSSAIFRQQTRNELYSTDCC